MVSERAEESFLKRERGLGNCKFTYHMLCGCFSVAIVCSFNFVAKLMLLYWRANSISFSHAYGSLRYIYILCTQVSNTHEHVSFAIAIQVLTVDILA